MNMNKLNESNNLFGKSQLDLFSVFVNENSSIIDHDKVTISKGKSHEENIQFHSITGVCTEYEIIHPDNGRIESDVLNTFHDYDPTVEGLRCRWNEDDVFIFFSNMFEWSIKSVRYILNSGNCSKKLTSNRYTIHPVLDDEFNWYMTDQFKLVCGCLGYDSEEIISVMKQELIETVHPISDRMKRYRAALNDKETIIHDYKDRVNWCDFFDEDYFPESKSVALKWSDKSVVKLFSAVFKESMSNFDKIASQNLCYLRDGKGKYYINPDLVRELEWFETDLFSIIATYFGYNVPTLRRDIHNIVEYSIV